MAIVLGVNLANDFKTFMAQIPELQTVPYLTIQVIDCIRNFYL